MYAKFATMRLTPEQIAKIRKKEAETPDALKRNPLNNYTEGWFHVTLNTRGEAPVLGYITGDPDAEDGTPNAPRCVLTELGRKVEEEWRGIGRYYPACICEEIKAMPDHIHALMHLLPTNKAHLGRIINGLMIGCTHCYWDTLGIPWREMRKQIEEALKRNNHSGGTSASNHDQDKALRAQWQDRDHTRSYRGPALFVRGYNDVEAVGEDEIDIKRQYIHNNPRKHLIQRDKPDLFRVRRNMTSANWTPERIMSGLCADRFIAADRSRQIEAWRQIITKGIRNSRGKVSATLKFQSQVTTASNTTNGAMTNVQTITRPVIELVGNIELLKRPLFPLVCHRADGHLYEQQKEAVLKVTREQGGVIVTACVSPKERDIVKMLQRELLPVIEVMDNGFSDKYKPIGKAFYAVAEQRRLEVSPWEHEYRRREMRPVKDKQGNAVLDADGKPEMEEIPDISRETCMVMIELVRVISKKDDDWWK